MDYATAQPMARPVYRNIYLVDDDTARHLFMDEDGYPEVESQQV